MSQQFGPTPLQKIWLYIQVMEGQEAALAAIMRHYQASSIEERLTNLKCGIPETDIDIVPVRYEPTDLRLE